MIQSPEGVDRGQYLFKRYEGAITQLCQSLKQQWFESIEYKGLANRCKSMDKYLDNSNTTQNFISDITPSTLRKAYYDYTALIEKFLETDPLYGVAKSEKTPQEIQKKIQLVINDNLEKTYFRERCLSWNIEHIVKYGTAAIYTFATSDYNANSLMTVKSEDGFGDYRQVYGSGENAILSTPIHPLNIIIDRRSNYMVEPDYLGFIGDISISNISNLANNEVYIQKNVREVLKHCKQGLPDAHWFAGNRDEGAMRNFSRGHSNISYLWTTLPFEGNEDDPTKYAIEMIDKYIIRCEENILDGNTIPLSIQRVNPRPYTWYGNSPLDDKICIQNMQYWLINTYVESTTRLMDRVVFYDQGDIDVEAINSRHQTGGWVPYRGQKALDKLVYSPQLPNNSYREADWLMQEMRRQDQDTNPMPNFNPMSEGGPTNKTLGGAQIMASIGELRTNAIINKYSIGLRDVPKQTLAILRNVMADNDVLKIGDEEITKDDLVQSVTFSVKLSNVFNYLREGIDAENRLNLAVNRRATQIPQFKAVRLAPLLEDALRNSLKRENIDDYLNTNLLKQIDDNEQKQIEQSLIPQGAPVSGQVNTPQTIGPTNPQPAQPSSPVQSGSIQ